MAFSYSNCQDGFQPTIWAQAPQEPTAAQQAAVQRTKLQLESFARRATNPNTRDYLMRTIIPKSEWVLTHYHLIPVPSYDASPEQYQAYRQKMQKLANFMAFIANNAESSNQAAFEELLPILDSGILDRVETHLEISLATLQLQGASLS